MIWILIINIIIFYQAISVSSEFMEQADPGIARFYLGIIATSLILLSLVFIIISTIKKEKKNYQYWISIIGIFIFGIFPLALKIF